MFIPLFDWNGNNIEVTAAHLPVGDNLKNPAERKQLHWKQMKNATRMRRLPPSPCLAATPFQRR